MRFDPAGNCPRELHEEEYLSRVIVQWTTLRPILECPLESRNGPVVAKRRVLAACRRFMLKLFKVAEKSSSFTEWRWPFGLRLANRTRQCFETTPPRDDSYLRWEKKKKKKENNVTATVWNVEPPRRSLFMKYSRTRFGRFCAAPYVSLTVRWNNCPLKISWLERCFDWIVFANENRHEL